MKYTEVQSSAITAIGYDEKTRQMEVIFLSGATVMHEDVSKERHGLFVRADSIGKAYASMFRDTKPVEIDRKLKFGK
jgi:hypothetical protein